MGEIKTIVILVALDGAISIPRKLRGKLVGGGGHRPFSLPYYWTPPNTLDVTQYIPSLGSRTGSNTLLLLSLSASEI